MSDEIASRTGSTLLVLLRDPGDPAAWSAFVARYGPRIYGWCRGRRLQEADAQDVTQNVLLKLVKKLRTFTYDPQKGTFRGWLKTLTYHALSDYLESRQRQGTGTGDSAIQERLQSEEDRRDLLRSLEEAFDLEVWAEAQARVQFQVTPRDWKIFQELTVPGRRAADVAEQFEATVAAVLMAKSRVKKLLRAAVRLLEGSGRENQQGEP
jgi:RNA polymerase sigma-70 factor (ECF subfamily)